MDIRSRLARYLPPFASDYAGAASALYGLDGMVVLCDAGCCTDHYVFYDEPRWEQKQTNVFSTTLRSVDAVLGCDKDIVERCCALARSLPEPPRFVAFLGTPVPALVGMDARGVACEIEATLGIPSIGLDMTGFRYYDHGIELACKELLARFIPEVGKQPVRSGADSVRVNIIGATPLDLGSTSHMSAIVDALEGTGLSVNARLPWAADIEEIARIPQADVNLAVSAAGIKVAHLLERRFGIPYVAACPLDAVHLLDSSNGALLAEIARAINGAALNAQSGLPGFLVRAEDAEGKRILVVGDQVAANSVAWLATKRFPKACVAVSSPFAWDTNIAASQDFCFEGEFDLAEKAAEFQSDLIIADPLYDFLVRKVPDLLNKQYIPFIHPAISSKLYWKDMS